MRIIVNGQPMEVREARTLAELMADLGVRRDHAAVALNREVIPRDRHATTVLREGDRVEVVHPMAGGSAGSAPPGVGWAPREAPPPTVGVPLRAAASPPQLLPAGGLGGGRRGPLRRPRR